MSLALSNFSFFLFFLTDGYFVDFSFSILGKDRANISNNFHLLILVEYTFFFGSQAMSSPVVCSSPLCKL